MKDYIYLIKCRPFRFYKIGMSTTMPLERLRALQTGSPFRLELVAFAPVEDAYGIEKSLHDKYSLWRVRGEWFGLAKEAVDEIEQYFHLLDEIDWTVQEQRDRLSQFLEEPRPVIRTGTGQLVDELP